MKHAQPRAVTKGLLCALLGVAWIVLAVILDAGAPWRMSGIAIVVSAIVLTAIGGFREMTRKRDREQGRRTR